MEKTCPHCHQVFQVENGRVFSNHVRWCPENQTNGDKGRANIGKAGTLPRIKIKKICLKCGKEFEVKRVIKNGQEKAIKGEPKFCSSTCSHSRVLSEDSRRKIGDKQRRPDKICPQCGKTYNSKSNTCSNSCSMKYRYRNVDKTSLHYYRLQCRFDFALSDYPEEFDFTLIEEHGWYKAKNHGDNLNGVSRDHIVSIRYGFDHGIPAEVIRHPANCQLLRHSDNSSKHDKCSMTIEELYEKIQRWNEKYGRK